MDRKKTRVKATGRRKIILQNRKTSSSEEQPLENGILMLGDRDKDDQSQSPSGEDQAPWQKHDGQEDTQKADDIPEKENGIRRKPRE